MTIFTTSGAFTVPKGYKEVEVFLVGGGGRSFDSTTSVYGGGGGGYTKTEKLSANSGDEINISIGSSASKTIVNDIYASPGNFGTQWNDSWFGTLCTGGAGGSGGGARGWGSYGNGGSDGGSGGGTSDFVFAYQSTCRVSGGVGQGTTTKAFGESTGTLYAGGGGGFGGAGGSGGGGNWNCNGQSNTGGGAGGKGREGGSGIAIIRWGY